MTSIHPRLQQFMDEVAQAPVHFTEMPIEEARQRREELGHVPEEQQEPVARVEQRTIKGPHGPLDLRIFIPNGEGPFPVVMFFHGGGWVFGSADLSAPLARKIANRTPAVVVSVEYHLSPEVKYPAAVEECYAATQWAAEFAEEMEGDASRIAVAGESAGATVAAVVALMARNKGGPTLCHQLLFYPACSFEYPPEEVEKCADKTFLTPESMHWYAGHYLPSPEAADEPYCLPGNADDLRGLPNAYFVLAEHDILTPGALRYLKSLDDADVGASGRVHEGMIHAFVGFPFPFPPGDEAVDEAIDHLRNEFTL